MTAKVGLARRSLAERAAAAVLREQKIDGLKVDPIKIAESKDIHVQAKPDTADGVSGLLIKIGDQFGIMYATHIRSEGFRRFSIAHELGHYFIEGHPDALLSGGLHESRAGFISVDSYEQEADHFAAALLMPEHPFRHALDDYDAGLGCIQVLSKACETSLTATAIRYSALTRDGVAVILSRGPSIEWCFISEGLKQAKGLSYLRKSTPVPSSTLTHGFNSEPENIIRGDQFSGEGLLNDWMDGERRYNIIEEVIGLGQYGRTLTVLTCQALTLRPEEEELEDDEAQLIESWTPRFRK